METKVQQNDFTIMELFVSRMILGSDAHVNISECNIKGDTCFEIDGKYGERGIIAKHYDGTWVINYNKVIVKSIGNNLFEIIKPLNITDNDDVLARYELIKSHYDKMVANNEVFGMKFVFIRDSLVYIQDQISISARFLSNNTSFDKLSKTYCVVSEGLDDKGNCEVKYLDTFYANFIQSGECKSFNIRNCLN